MKKKKGINITSPNILARYMKTDGQELQRLINATVLWKGNYNYIYLKFRLGCKSDKCGVRVMVFNAANIDKFVNIRYIFLIARRAYS